MVIMNHTESKMKEAYRNEKQTNGKYKYERQTNTNILLNTIVYKSTGINFRNRLFINIAKGINS